MITALATVGFIFAMYFMYGLGVVHGQRYEEKRRRIEQKELMNSIDGEPKKKAYSWFKHDGYEIFHVNLN